MFTFYPPLPSLSRFQNNPEIFTYKEKAEIKRQLEWGMNEQNNFYRCIFFKCLFKEVPTAPLIPSPFSDSVSSKGLWL